jgi:hypothetical protein
MLSSPLAIVTCLAAIVAIVFQVAERPALAPLFRRLPAVFWVYVLPMILTSLGVLPAESPLYGALARNLLPASLALILLSSDLKAITRLGPRALAAMAAASLGVVAGAVLAFLTLGRALGGSWKGVRGAHRHVDRQRQPGRGRRLARPAGNAQDRDPDRHGRAYSWMALRSPSPGRRRRSTAARADRAGSPRSARASPTAGRDRRRPRSPMPRSWSGSR